MIMSEDILIKLKQAQTNIKIKEEKAKAEEEAKLLGTAMQQLLPEIFEDKRAIPNCFLRGALFGMVRKGKRALVENKPIFTMSHHEVSFSGSEMDQNDLELWDTLIYLAKERNVENELRITLYDLCQQMRLTYNQERANKLKERALRLKFGMVSIKHGSKLFAGNLINNVYIDIVGDGKLVIEYNKKLTPLFADSDYMASQNPGPATGSTSPGGRAAGAAAAAGAAQPGRAAAPSALPATAPSTVTKPLRSMPARAIGTPSHS